MKELKDFENEIYKCSRCGLCQSVCPVYKATLNECAVSRGKFNMLNGIIKGDINLTKKVKKYLDLCTGCNACKDFCPSQINAKEIFITAKSEYYKIQKITFLEKLLNSYTLFKTLLLCGKLFFAFYRFFQIDKIVNIFKKTISKQGILGKRLLLLNSLATKRKIRSKSTNKTKTLKAVYFEGCFNQYLNSETKEAVKKIFENSNIELINEHFECCGISYLNDGNVDEFKKLINLNTQKLNYKYDYLITDCASCYDVLKNYKSYTENPRTKEISNKIISIVDLIKPLKFKTLTNLRIAVHKPCHDDSNFIDLVKNIKDINFVEIEEYDTCCGFSGKFALQNSEISRNISQNKIKQYTNKNVDVILTTCPACLLGLAQGLAETKCSSNTIAMNLFVFLATYCEQI